MNSKTIDLLADTAARAALGGALNEDPCELIALLDNYGSPATIASTEHATSASSRADR